mmetsp:Transcript_104851/g.201281  ORF Transcript_104851/g.201281 Transcript_104851/m.201281 type:complete len:124 (-) Transcript_104851:164-535(-)
MVFGAISATTTLTYGIEVKPGANPGNISKSVARSCWSFTQPVSQKIICMHIIRKQQYINENTGYRHDVESSLTGKAVIELRSSAGRKQDMITCWKPTICCTVGIFKASARPSRTIAIKVRGPS